jgi:hypothetical protein
MMYWYIYIDDNVSSSNQFSSIVHHSQDTRALQPSSLRGKGLRPASKR